MVRNPSLLLRVWFALPIATSSTRRRPPVSAVTSISIYATLGFVLHVALLRVRSLFFLKGCTQHAEAQESAASKTYPKDAALSTWLRILLKYMCIFGCSSRLMSLFVGIRFLEILPSAYTFTLLSFCGCLGVGVLNMSDTVK